MNNFKQRTVLSRFFSTAFNIAALAFCALLSTSVVHAQGIQPVVAIHDSELTRALETMPAVSPTPTGPGNTGFQWWSTNWHYFVMPEALQEMLRSDGTAFKVVRDSDITAGLLNPNGTPKYPIVISLASEAIRDDEITPLTDYVSAGGFLFIGGSSFTRNPNGTTRGDFAIADAMGMHVISSSLANWGFNLNVTKQVDHRIVDHLPDGQLTWRMPSAAEEISWGVATAHPYLASHQVWRAQASDATVLAQGDNYPYLTVKKYGNGYIIYCAAFQPLIAHGGFGPGMYAYAIFRNAIEWASETTALPVVKLSPWPYQFDSAFIIRHDLENFASSINHIEASAQYEKSRGVKGDYYFCTGTLREDMAGPYDVNAVISSLQRAISQNGATIGPHNGGLKNPLNLQQGTYDYWHWGPDEVLNTQPAGYPNGRTYALASISNSFVDIERWLPGLMTSSMRIWCAPYFNGTREDSYALQEQIGVKITGDQKLSPFPHWNVSTRTSGKRYSTLSQPVSDWFVGGLVAQSLEPWHPPGVQTTTTLHSAIDFYYDMGLFINFYSHTLSTGEGDAGALVPEYIDYCMDSLRHPRMWAANGISIYDWWSRRTSAQITASYSASGGQNTTTISITGATDANTAVEIVAPSQTALANVQVYRNGNLAPSSGYRINGRILKVPVGTTISNVQIVYSTGGGSGASATPDSYSTPQNTPLTVPAPGVLANDVGASGATVQLASGPSHGTLNLSANGGFTYTPASGYSGTDTFTYQINSGGTLSSPATVTITITATGVLFSDDFTRTSIAPWVQRAGTWSIANNALVGASPASAYGNAYYNASGWTDYQVSAQIRFSSASGYGGGVGGRLNPTTGAHYAAWVYPENSSGGSSVMKLVKFSGWTTWSGTPMQQVTLPGVGTTTHTVALTMSGNNITASYDGVTVINVNDNNFDGTAPFTGGGISADIWTSSTAYSLTFDNVSVTSLVSGTTPSITSQPQSQTVSAGQSATFSVGASGTVPLNYQWRFNGNAISGATASSYTHSNAQAADAGNYTVLVSNSYGSVTSAVATLTVTAAGTPPSITSQPQSQTVTTGQGATFTVSAAGTAPLNYQWRFNGNAISGATASSYSRSNAQAADAGNYTVLVSNSYGSVTSAVATLTVTTSGTPPSITSQPQSQTVAVGQNATFSVGASGTAPLNYQWRFNGNAIAGATGISYTRSNAQLTDAGDYTVQVSNAYGTVTSAVATLMVNLLSVPPVIAVQPLPQTVIAGQSATFSVVATGTAPLSYQWRFNNNPIAGATGSSYTVSSAQVANAGNYSVLVSNDAGLVASSSAALTVNYSLTTSATGGGLITVSPLLQTGYAPGSQVTLTAAPLLGFRFAGWSGSVSSGANPLTITMNANMTIKAKFQKSR